MRVRDIMQADPIRIPATMRFLEIQRLFVTAHISSAPVVDERGSVLGTIDLFDLVRVIDQLCDEDVDPAEDLSPDAATSAPMLGHLRDLTASDVFSPEVFWISPDASAAQVADLMRTEGTRRALVGHDGKLEGIVTAFDLLQAVARDSPLDQPSSV